MLVLVVDMVCVVEIVFVVDRVCVDEVIDVFVVVVEIVW